MNECYKCKHRRSVPGSCHSQCAHPAFAETMANPLSGLLVLMGKRAGPIQVQSEECKVVGNEHSIASGWFNHPFNFDPVWLESCTGFTPIQEPVQS